LFIQPLPHPAKQSFKINNIVHPGMDGRGQGEYDGDRFSVTESLHS